jgi:hypothetical protein
VWAERVAGKHDLISFKSELKNSKKKLETR